MKKYLLGLGAMLVGAGLMFVLMHGEVKAEEESKVAHCEIYKEPNSSWNHYYCKIKDLSCVTTIRGTSCVKS